MKSWLDQMPMIPLNKKAFQASAGVSESWMWMGRCDLRCNRCGTFAPSWDKTLQELNPRNSLVLLLCNRLHFITMSSKGPYQPNMQGWRNLINLDIRGNFLTGTIPDKLWDATLVQQLNFAENDLTGSKGPRLKSWQTWKAFMFAKINWQAAYHQILETLGPWCSLGSTPICFKIVCPPSSAVALN